MARPAFVEELEVLLVALEDGIDAELRISLCTFHNVEQVCEGQLRLDHPKLCDVPGGVRLISAESRSEGVNVGE